MGGVAISPSAEVLDVNGYPILGLFGAGEVTGVSSCFFFVFFFEFFYDFKMKVFFFFFFIYLFEYLLNTLLFNTTGSSWK